MPFYDANSEFANGKEQILPAELNTFPPPPMYSPLEHM